jgi:hypothetical protein
LACAAESHQSPDEGICANATVPAANRVSEREQQSRITKPQPRRTQRLREARGAAQANGVKRAISILAMDITNFGFHGVPSQRQKAR